MYGAVRKYKFEFRGFNNDSLGANNRLDYGITGMAGTLLVVSTVLGSLNEHLHNLTQSLLLHLLLGLQDHVDQLLIICFTWCHHLHNVD